MKTIVAIALLASTPFFGYSQDLSENQAPSVVRNTFRTHYPTTTDVEWEREPDRYEVTFEVNQPDHIASLTPIGKLVEIAIEKADLPKVVTDAVQRDWEGYLIDDVDKIDEGGKITYQLEVEKEQAEYTVHYSAEGSLQARSEK
jgi:hypothetical protein